MSRRPNRSDPSLQRVPSLQGQIITYTVEGQLRARSWPRAKWTETPSRRAQVQWFREARELAKRVDPGLRAEAIRATKGTGLYPDDLVMMGMAGNIMALELPDGTPLDKANLGIDPVSYQGVIAPLDGDQAFGGGTFGALQWDLPFIDTMGLWNVADPREFVIPDGVTVVSAGLSMRIDWSSGTRDFSGHVEVNGGVVARSRQTSPPNGLLTLTTGPMVVAGGDVLVFFGNVAVGYTVRALPMTRAYVAIIAGA